MTRRVLPFAQPSNPAMNPHLPARNTSMNTLGLRLLKTERNTPAAAAEGKIEVEEFSVELRGLIALGNFGALFEGVVGETKVAVKQLRNKWLHNPRVLEDFKNEILVLSKLSHPNIVDFIGCVHDQENVPKLVCLEWVEGGDLSHAIHKCRGTPRELLASERLLFMEDFAKGMEYLHSRNPCVIHRDLKPHNLLLTMPVGHGLQKAATQPPVEVAASSNVAGAPRRRVVKIADFGLSRYHDLEHGVNSMTGNTGSLRWMAPEVMACKKYNEKVDVYSFAMVVWEMFALEIPYKELNVIQVALAVGRGTRPKLPSSCSPAVAKVINRCWSGHHEDRLSFEDIVKECRAIIDSEQSFIEEEERAAMKLSSKTGIGSSIMALVRSTSQKVGIPSPNQSPRISGQAPHSRPSTPSNVTQKSSDLELIDVMVQNEEEESQESRKKVCCCIVS